MVAPHRRWASLFSLACCMALLLGHLGSAAPMHPKYPGDNAPVEDLVQFYNELQQYLNMVTRPSDTARDPAAGRSVETPMTPRDAKPASELKGHDPERKLPWGEQEKA
ncbi:unnamed protein product [Natator depressus]